MSDVIKLKNGDVHVILEPRDFTWVLEQELGWDAEKYFERLIEKLDEESAYTSQAIESDLASYELSLESNTACFQDILEVLEQMKSILEAPRMNKNKMFKLVEQVQKEICNQI